MLSPSRHFFPVASGTRRVCKNNTRHLSSPLASRKFSDKHQNSGPNITVDKLNKSKSSGLVNVFMLVLLLVPRLHVTVCVTVTIGSGTSQ